MRLAVASLAILWLVPAASFRAPAPAGRITTGAAALHASSRHGRLQCAQPAKALGLEYVVDSVIGAAGAAIGIGALHAIDELTGRSVSIGAFTFSCPVYAPPLAASACFCFCVAEPPPYFVVCGAVAGSITAAVAAVQVFGATDLARVIAVAVTAAWFQLGGLVAPQLGREDRDDPPFFFPPTAALAALLLDDQALIDEGFLYVLFPCLAGNSLLWAGASGLAPVRRWVRRELRARSDPPEP